MPKKKETQVPERSATPRAVLREALLGRALTPREIGKRTGMRDKEVAEHLEHLARSLARGGDRLVVEPATCLACGYAFEARHRFSVPGRCPSCRSERIASPSFRIDASGDTAKRPSPPAGLDPAARSRDDADAMAGHERTPATTPSSSASHDVVLHVERAVSAAIFATTAGEDRGLARVASGAEAVHAAVAASREGKRAAAVLAPSELLGALEALHAAARARAPIVVHVLGGADDGGASAGRDEIAPAMDTGAGVVVTWNVQESVDLTLAVRRAAEDAETPFLLVTDGAGAVMTLPGSGLVEQFLGASRAEARAETPRPEGGGGAASRAHALESKRRERSFAARVPFALAAAMRELGDLTGRPIAPAERYETTDAEEIVVAVGQGYAAARAAAEALRREGRRVGAVGVRVLRPFFSSDLVKAVARARAVAVIEPLDVALAPAGPLATCLKAAFADALTWAPGFPGVGHIPPIVSVVFATLAGAVTEREIREALSELSAGDRARRLLVFGSDGTA